MKLKKVKYGDFSRNIFNPMKNDERHELFYCSLFDPSSWEELEELRDFQQRLGVKAINLIRKTNQEFFRKYVEPRTRGGREEGRESFLASFLYLGDLCNFMLASALRDRNVDIPFNGIGKPDLPDLVINFRGVPRGGIEIKRLISCSNLKERIDNEVIPLFESTTIENLILLLIFPAITRIDRPERVHQLIGGCHVFEYYIQNKIKNKKRIKVLCKCIKEEYRGDSAYFFESLIETLLENLSRENLIEKT